MREARELGCTERRRASTVQDGEVRARRSRCAHRARGANSRFEQLSTLALVSLGASEALIGLQSGDMPFGSYTLLKLSILRTPIAVNRNLPNAA